MASSSRRRRYIPAAWCVVADSQRRVEHSGRCTKGALRSQARISLQTMKLRAIIAAVVLGAVACAFAIAAKGAEVNDAYAGLRDMALGMTPDMLGLSASPPSSRPYAVITDISLKKGVATVVAGLGGQASIYLSTGGGYIGGEGNERVSTAATAAVEAAASALSEMHPTKNHPIPEQGNVNFYVLTTAGIMTASSSEAALGDTKQPLGRLYYAVQNVITQYRLMQQ
jgi:hypothetical protein